jgi:diguanylate cyclase (GGDEF)-like protein
MVDSDKKLLLELQRRNDELATLVEIGKTLTSTLDREDVLNVIMEKVSLLLESKTWSLLLTDEETGDLIFEIAVSPGNTDLKGVRLKKGEGIAGRVAASGEPLLISDVRDTPYFSSEVDEITSQETHSIICVPLKNRNRILGVIELVNTGNELVFDETVLPILTVIADYVAIAIENSQYFAKINQLIITDDLTGLYNSRHFNQLIEYETERAIRYDNPLALVFFDLDHFKQINDTHGHLVGSRILTEVGKLVQRYTRKVNLAARYGGDEFVILLPSTDKKSALLMAESLLSTICNHPFKADDGTPIQLTASFGVASMPEDTSDRKELVFLADKAMYRVKETTRNAVLAN